MIPEFRFYGRRRSKPIAALKAQYVKQLLPDYRLTPATLVPWVNQTRRLAVELGFGYGEHLLAQAQAHPDIAYIGAELYENGIAQAVAALATTPLPNLRLWPADARELIKLLPHDTVEQVYILYPDPWPKRRQQKRRLINQPFLDQLAQRLRRGGTLTFVSDHAAYVNWVAYYVRAQPNLLLTYCGARPEPAVVTRYEAKAKEEGRQGIALIAART